MTLFTCSMFNPNLEWRRSVKRSKNIFLGEEQVHQVTLLSSTEMEAIDCEKGKQILASK